MRDHASYNPSGMLDAPAERYGRRFAGSVQSLNIIKCIYAYPALRPVYIKSNSDNSLGCSDGGLRVLVQSRYDENQSVMHGSR